MASLEAVAEAIWAANFVSILWPAELLHTLPYVEFGIDVVLVNNTAPSLSSVPGGSEGGMLRL